MHIILLGSGTSTGVPLIGCDCEVCTSGLPKNKRLRSSLFLSTWGGNIVIDTSTDLRQQALHNGIRRIDAVLFTHSHADHVHGIDELRSFNHLKNGRIPCYGSRETVTNLKRMFFYIFEKDTQIGGGLPRLDMFPVEDSFQLFGLDIQPIPVMHGKLAIFGYRIQNMAYITDCSEFPSSSLKYLRGLDLLFINALRYEPHPTHFNVEKALGLIKSVNPKRGVILHLGHQIDYYDNHKFPKNVELAYDNMVIDLE